jgi:hypothetical protein
MTLITKMSIVVALGLFAYEFLRGVYEIFDRSVFVVNVVKWILLIGVTSMIGLTVISLIFSLILQLTPGNIVQKGPLLALGQIVEKILLAVAFFLSVCLVLLVVAVLSQTKDEKIHRFHIPAIRMLFVAIVICICMAIRVIVSVYQIYGPVFVPYSLYFGLVWIFAEPLFEVLLFVSIFFRFYSFRARQIMSKSMVELVEPLLDRESGYDNDEWGDKPIPQRYSNI